MNVSFNENLNEVFVEDDTSDNEYNDLVNNNQEEEEEEVKNEIIEQKPSVEYRKLPPYYRQQRQQQRQQNQQMSYDDILQSMNMRVVDGKLEMINTTSKEGLYKAQIPYQNNDNQNNYIYNKYFKDYSGQQQQQDQAPRRPLTPHEYRAALIRRQIEIQNARRRINQIKPKKLLFSTTNINVSDGQRPNDMNKLFRFVGK